MTRYDVLIVGGGHAGAQAAIALRQRGYEGTIAIIGAEPDLPYERPPLSKDYLAGKKSFERILLRPPAFWPDRSIELMLGTPVTSIDADAHRVVLDDGKCLGYRILIWAAGGMARQIDCPGHHLGGIHSIRTRADVDQLASELAKKPRVVAIGGGYIGLEAAAVLASFGIPVTLLESQSRVLSRVAGEELSSFYEKEHRAAGVDLRTNVMVERLEGATRVEGVRLADGSLIPADLVIAAVGILPAVGPLVAAGAQGGNGVTVDTYCRTDLPDVYAIGDCAAHPNRFAGNQIVRLESVQNAADQAATVAGAIVGSPQPYGSVPWFWSNQYDLRLQTIGLSAGHDAVVVRGEMSTRRFSIAYLRRGRILAFDCVNAAKDYVQARPLVMEHAKVSLASLADASIPLRALHMAAV